MKTNSFIILFSFLVILNAKIFAQPDCFFKYCYVGKIDVNKSDTSGAYLQVPSVELMKKIVKGRKGLIDISFKEGNYKRELITIGSSFFCGTPESIIERIFKGNKNKYAIYVIKNKKRYRRTIDIKDITFKNENGVVYIELPVIPI